MKPKGHLRHSRVVGIAAAAVVLAPFGTVTLTYRRALVVQAGLALAVVLLLGLLAMLRNGLRGVLRANGSVLLGVALYGAAALQGMIVAIVRGNDLTLAAGQFLAMGLLPLAALAAMGSSTPLEWHVFATGVVGGFTAGALIQVAVRGPATIGDPLGSHLVLPNAVSVSGAAPLVVLLALALTTSTAPLVRALAWLGAATATLIIFAAGIRSQWLVIPVGFAVFLGLGVGRTRLFSRRTISLWCTGLLALLVGVAAFLWWWNHPRPNLASGHLDSVLSAEQGGARATLPPQFGGALRIRGTLTCRGHGCVFLRVRGASDPPTVAPQRVIPLVVAGLSPSNFLVVDRPRVGEKEILLDLEDPSKLGCRATSLVAEELTPGWAAELVGRLAGLLRRPPDPGAGPEPGAFAGDSSIAFRVRESRAVLAAVRGASPVWTVFGQGLGATYHFETVGYDNMGQIVRYDRPNYIHNYYLFLLFKLGALGSLAVLLALGMWVWATVAGARENPSGGSYRWFFSAAAAAWSMYIAWSVAAPEILDFRLAPIWGMLLASTAAVPHTGPKGPV